MMNTNPFRRFSRWLTLVAAVGAMGVAWANSSYTVDGNVLKISVPAGETNNFDSVTWLATLTENQVTDVLKEGDGGLIMNADISTYSGTIHITNGTWRVIDKNGLGLLTNGGAVYVTDGATLEGRSAEKSGIAFAGKTIYFEGCGKNGVGALVVACSAHQQSCTWGSTMVMTGDAFVNGLTDYNYYFNNVALNMQGHALTLRIYQNANQGRRIVCKGLTITNPGTIEVVDSSVLQLEDLNTFNGSKTNYLVMRDKSWICVSAMRGNFKWTLDWRSAGTNQINGLSTYTNYPRNTWDGPVVLNRQMATLTKRDCALNGEISGVGGLAFLRSADAPTITLGSSNNTFQGGVVSSNVSIKACAGAIPAAGADLKMSDADLVLGDGNHALPTGVLTVASENVSVITNGTGAWRQLVKKGAGQLDCRTRVGSDELVVQEGSVRLKALGIGPWMAGVVEGIGYYTDRANAYADMGKCVTNRTSVQSYPQHLYTSFSDADRKSQSWCTIPSGGGYLICYSGYLWNHSSENVTWTFAGTLSAQSIVVIDGKTVFKNVSTSVCSHENVTLTPGAHSFYIANAAKINDGGTTKSPTNMTWSSKGICYDPQGRNSENQADYIQLKNPTDGSLPILTWCKPGEIAATPVPDKILDREVVVSGGTSTNVTDQALFAKLSFGADTTVDFDGSAYGLDELSGIPTVLNSNGLSIRDKWTVDVADLLAGRKLSDVALAFGDDAELVVTASVRPKSGSWVIAESTEDISGNLTIKDETLAKDWTITVKDRQVVLTRKARGLVILFR